MDPRNFYFIDNALRKGNFDDLNKYIHSAADLYAKGQTMDKQEMTVAEMFLRDRPMFLPALRKLMDMGFSPADPEVDRTGLFRIANVLSHVSHNDLSEAEVVKLLEEILALAPEADLRNLAGTHPIRMVGGHSKWTRDIMDWVLAHTNNLEELDAEMPLLYHMGYDNSMNLFLHFKLLMEAGANANWEVEDEYVESNALFWLLQSIPIPTPLLYLFIENGASWSNFLFALIGIRKKKFLPHIAPVAAAYLEQAHNLPQLDLTDGYGFTALHHAVMKQDIALVAHLVAAGAKTDIPSSKSRTLFKVKASKGATATSIAQQLGSEALISALKGNYPIPTSSFDDLQESLSQPGLLPAQFDRFMEFMNSRPGISWRVKPKLRTGIIDSTTCKIIDQAWSKRSANHMDLLRIGWFFGGMECGWSLGKDVGGGFRIADWSEMVTQNILCFHEDYGRTYFRITKKGIQLSFSATYESYKLFPLKLSLEEFFQRLFQVGGMPYWTYFFFKSSAPYIEKIPFFQTGLEKLAPEGDLAVFER